MYCHSFSSLDDGRGRFAQTCVSLTQKGMRLARDKRIRRHLLELAVEILCRVPVSGTRRGDIAGALLTQTEKKFFDVACVAIGLGSQSFREYLYGRSITAPEQRMESMRGRIETGVCEQRFHRLEIAARQEDIRFHRDHTEIAIRWHPCKGAVDCGQGFWKTAQHPIGSREIPAGMDVARIKLNGPALLHNCLFPVPKPPLESGDRFENISAVRKTFFGLAEFRQRPGVVALCVMAVIAEGKMSFR